MFDDTESEPRWFAVRVKPRHEKTVSQIFAHKRFEQLLPLYQVRRKWADRQKDVALPLFPGYVFCRFDAQVKVPILNTPGVIHIVKTGCHLAPIEDREIAALQALMNSGLPCEPWPRLEVGQKVEIDAGPLEGLSGKVIEIKKTLRLILAVTLLHRSVLVEIDREWIVPARPSREFQACGHSGLSGLRQ